MEKQETDSNCSSTTESEIIAATHDIRELLWIQNMLKDFDINVQVPILFCDSQSAIAIATSAGYNGRTKHMDVKYKFMAESVSKEHIFIEYLPTNKMIADTLTKSLPRPQFEYLKSQMGLKLSEWVGVLVIHPHIVSPMMSLAVGYISLLHDLAGPAVLYLIKGSILCN